MYGSRSHTSAVLAAILALALTIPFAALPRAQRSVPKRPWPPGVQQVPPESPALAPADALKTFFMPPGYRIELVASEPLVQEPVALDWDTAGRLWVVEMPGFMADITGSNEHEPIGRIVVLEDVDGDGRMDRRTVFADHLVLARSLKVLDRGVLVAEPPNVWLMRDTTGDLRMDTKELVTNRYGRFEGDPQNNANGFYWGLDNRMYTAGQSDIQLRLKDGVFEVQPTLQRGEFLASTDERFRPVYLSNAPDGTLYIADMYRGIIEHRISITMYLRDQILARKLDRPTGYGRIYRVVHDTTRRDLTRPFGQASPAELVSALSHPNGWRRDTAQRLLVERGNRSVVPALAALAGTAPDARTRLHALWTLDGLDAIEPATVMKALEDGARDVRVSAIRIAERWLGEPDHPIVAAVLKRLDDRDWAVRKQLAASIGALPNGPREDAAVAILDRYGDDPVVMDAALSGLRGSEARVLDRLLERKPGAAR
jgi:glucose/arabinose dehydrogenase